MTSNNQITREMIITRIREVRAQLAEAEKEERKALLEQLCVLYAWLAAIAR